MDIKESIHVFKCNIQKTIAYHLPDKMFLKKQFKEKMGYNLNLKNPKTFNEKINWLKIYNRKPMYTILADKYAVRDYITEKIGKEYLIPLIGVWNSVDEIDFASLPNQFVLKCNHDSESVVICKDKNSFDVNSTKDKLSKCLKRDSYKPGREWSYKNIKRKIIAEKYMEDFSTKELRDYKFYCFDGYVHALLVATDRQSSDNELHFDYFDNNYNHLNLVNHWHPNAPIAPEKPKNYDTMIKLAQILSKGIPHVRIDFYEANNKVYFGEFTFYDNGGYLQIHPDNWELEWGNLIKL